jgi:hypothetical protein
MERKFPELYKECETCRKALSFSAQYTDQALERLAKSKGYRLPRFWISCSSASSRDDTLGIRKQMTPWLGHSNGSENLAYRAVNEVVCPGEAAVRISEKEKELSLLNQELSELKRLAG